MIRRGSGIFWLHRIAVLAAVCGGLVLLVESGPFSPEAGAALTTIDSGPRTAAPSLRSQDGAAGPAERPEIDVETYPTGPNKAGIATIPWPEDGFGATGGKLAPLTGPPAEEGLSFLQELPALRDTSLDKRGGWLSGEAEEVALGDSGFSVEEPSFAFDDAPATARPATARPDTARPDTARTEFQVGLAAGTRFGAADASGWLQPIVPTSEEERYCLALTIYFEARGESDLGKLAVAHVVMNRVTDRRFPNSICRVVRQGGEETRYRCQFTWWCDGLSDRPGNLRAWKESRALAESVYWGHSKDPTSGALWYHADYVAPRWAMAYRRTSQIGRHIFYQPTPQERRLAARRF